MFLNRFFLFLALILFLGASGALAADRASEKVTFVGALNISLAAIVATEKGFFAQEGLDVDFQITQTGKLAMEAVLSGRADFGSIVGTNAAYAGFVTPDLRIIASNGVTLDDAVVFPAHSSIQTAKDLKGKKIGLALSTSAQDFLIHLLAQNGLSWHDITPVSLQPPTMRAALQGEQVDAVAIWQPWRTGIRKGLEGGTREIENSAAIYPRQTFTASSAPYLAKHPNVAPKILRGLIAGEAFVNAHPEETAQIVAKKSGLDLDAIRATIAPVSIGLNHAMVTLISDYASWVVVHQEDFQGKTLPDYRPNIAASYLKAVAPERVEKGM